MCQVARSPQTAEPRAIIILIIAGIRQTIRRTNLQNGVNQVCFHVRQQSAPCANTNQSLGGSQYMVGNWRNLITNQKEAAARTEWQPQYMATPTILIAAHYCHHNMVNGTN